MAEYMSTETVPASAVTGAAASAPAAPAPAAPEAAPTRIDYGTMTRVEVGKPAPAAPVPVADSAAARRAEALFAAGRPQPKAEPQAQQDAPRSHQLAEQVRRERALTAREASLDREQRSTAERLALTDPAAAEAYLNGLLADGRARLNQSFAAAVDEIKGDPEFELLNRIGSHGEIGPLVNAHYQRTGQMLSVRDAARLLEQHLEAQLDKLRDSPKFHAPRPPPIDPNDRRPLTERDRLARAAAAFDAVHRRRRP